MTLPFTLLQADGGGSAFAMQLLLFGIIFAIFYLLVFRPMRKRQRDTETMLKNLQRGAKVITSGGVHGTIVGLQDDVVQLKVAENVKLQVSRTAIASVVENKS